MSILDDPSLWATSEDVRPPPQWNGTAWDFTDLDLQPFAFNAGVTADDLEIRYVGIAPLPSELVFNFTHTVAPVASDMVLVWAFDGVLADSAPAAEPGDPTASITVEIPNGTTEFWWQVFAISDAVGSPTAGALTLLGDGVESALISYNCACEDGDDSGRTLLDLRTSMLRRLGFSAQIASPPPGMAELLDDFLRDAQEQLYMRYESFRTERIFRWVMTPGVRYYDIAANDDLCTKRLNPYRISWAGIQDLNRSWMPLVCGIPPTFYTSDNYVGMPSRYEVRQCIEVYPAPDDYYTLRVKGHFGLMPFTEDAHRCTIDSHAVFLLALANAKAHYGKADAPNLFSQANSYIGSLVAGAHHTRRYIPRKHELPPLPRPRMVHFDDEP